MGAFSDWISNTSDQIFGTSSIGDAMADPDNVAGSILNLGIAGFLQDKMQVDRPDVGFQGEIPKYTAVRERVAQPSAPTQGKRVGIMTTQDLTKGGLGMMKDDPENEGERIPFTQEDANLQRFGGDRYRRGYERRPGDKGRRYFSDTIYAERPETEVPTLEEAEAKAKAQAEALSTVNAATGGHLRKYAHGGIAGAHKGYYLGGKTDGMADQVPARIDGKQEARLSDGEFVIPADVVSHLGNGNSDAGAQQLHNMMDNVRTARTGNPEQGKQINPQQFMPKMARGGLAKFSQGGGIKRFQEGGDVVTEASVDVPLGTESSLSNWAGEYVVDMLGQGQALGNQAYQAYEGPLTAGTSYLQDQAYTGISALNNPLSRQSVTNQMGTFTPDQATAFMNPYTDQVIDRTAADMRRQSQIDALQDRTAMTSAGAFGGSRDALMRAERASNLSRNIGDMSAEQRAAGYSQAMDRARAAQEMANQYGFDVLATQAKAGTEQRGIASEGIAADYGQFREEREYPYKQVQYMQSLLQGLPIAASSTTYTEPSAFDKLIQSKSGIDMLLDTFGYDTEGTSTAQENEEEQT